MNNSTANDIVPDYGLKLCTVKDKKWLYDFQHPVKTERRYLPTEEKLDDEARAAILADPNVKAEIDAAKAREAQNPSGQDVLLAEVRIVAHVLEEKTGAKYLVNKVQFWLSLEAKSEVMIHWPIVSLANSARRSTTKRARRSSPAPKPSRERARRSSPAPARDDHGEVENLKARIAELEAEKDAAVNKCNRLEEERDGRNALIANEIARLAADKLTDGIKLRDTERDLLNTQNLLLMDAVIKLTDGNQKLAAEKAQNAEVIEKGQKLVKLLLDEPNTKYRTEAFMDQIMRMF